MKITHFYPFFVQDPGKNPREISQQEIEVEKNRTIRKLADDGYFDGYAHYGIHEVTLPGTQLTMPL